MASRLASFNHDGVATTFDPSAAAKSAQVVKRRVP
jgi:hypothetical protein